VRIDNGVLVNNNSKNVKDMERAQAAFHKKEVQAREATKAMAEYEAAGDAVREKTARLKALRLAKEERDRESETRAATTAKIKAAVKKKRK